MSFVLLSCFDVSVDEKDTSQRIVSRNSAHEAHEAQNALRKNTFCDVTTKI